MSSFRIEVSDTVVSDDIVSAQAARALFGSALIGTIVWIAALYVVLS